MWELWSHEIRTLAKRSQRRFYGYLVMLKLCLCYMVLVRDYMEVSIREAELVSIVGGEL